MIRCILSILCISLPAFADTYRFNEQTTQIPYEVISSDLNFRVSHPLRVVVGTTDQVTGVMLADLQDLSRGVRLEAAVPVMSFTSSSGAVTSRIQRILASSEAAKMEFSSVKMTIAEAKKDDHFPFTFDGFLKLGKANTMTTAQLDCHVQGGALVCSVALRFQPTRLEIPLPKLAGLITENQVDVDGSITFRAQR